MREVEHVARTEEMRNEYKIEVWKTETKNLLGDLVVNGSVLLRKDLSKRFVRLWDGFSWPRIWSSGGFL
jgi:hypothetical protein